MYRLISSLAWKEAAVFRGKGGRKWQLCESEGLFSLTKATPEVLLEWEC